VGDARGFIARLVRCSAILVADRRIPRPIRWLGGLALLPIPGPIDEAVLLLIAPLLLVFYRRHMREAWGAALTSERATPR
jgi:hypothetical protein